MLIEVKVPVLPESITEATLVNWHKRAGDRVKRDENLVDVETDKVVLELPAPDSGALTEIIKGDGSTVTAGEAIAVIDTEGKGAQEAAPAAPASTSRPGGAAAASASAASSSRPSGATAASASAASISRPSGGAAAPPAPPSAPAAVTALPAARKMIAEQNLSAADVSGTERGGRITKA